VTKQSLKNGIVPYLMLICLGLSGCAVLDNTDELATLGSYSREKDAQHRLVKSINDHYDALAKAKMPNCSDFEKLGYCEGPNNYPDEASFVRSFGEPLIKKDMGDGTIRWLYRYAIYRLAKDKVYVYFDHHGKIIKWERLPCPKFF
jgi:hypothetical protein